MEQPHQLLLYSMKVPFILTQVMERLDIETNQIHNLLMDEIDSKRIYKANPASSSRVHKERAYRWVKQIQQERFEFILELN